MSVLCRSLLILCLFIGSARSELRLAKIFSASMVLQRDAEVPIWGWADPGDSVSVSFASHKVSATVGDDGQWLANLPSMEASSEERELVVSVEAKEEVILISDVVVGDVWHASGQSNMAFKMAQAAKHLPEVAADLASANLPAVRFCRVEGGPSKKALDDVASASWLGASPQTAGQCSAVAFYFARELHEKLGVPIGVIDTSRGGTPIEPYIPMSAFKGNATLVEELRLGESDDLVSLRRMRGGVYARDANWLPGRLFNSRVAPIRRMAVKGAIWYQGESNCGRQEDPRDYAVKMRALVDGWRQAFGQTDLPFYYVQLPGGGAGPGWPYLREQQRLALNTSPKVGMAVPIDLLEEDPSEIHPANKMDVGMRLARLALAECYGKDLVASGPLFTKAEIDGETVRVHFDHAEGGLKLAAKQGTKSPVPIAGKELDLVEMSSGDGSWHPAKAEIDGEKLIVRCAAVLKPVAVRYAYTPRPMTCHLYNQAGLPAAPFCSKPELLKYDPGLPSQ